MNEVWNLDPIYQGFGDPAFETDLEALKAQVKEFASFTEALGEMDPTEGLRGGIVREESIQNLMMKLGGYASLRQAADTRDANAGSQLGRVMSAYSDLAVPMAAFEEWASKVPDLMERVMANEDLKDYEFLFANLKESSRYLLPGIGEAVMAKMSRSGGDAWSEMQQYLTSTVPVRYRGETTNLSSIRNLAYDADPQVRKEAYEAELACYERIKDAIAYALNSIKLETISDCQLRGYESPLYRTL